MGRGKAQNRKNLMPTLTQLQGGGKRAHSKPRGPKALNGKSKAIYRSHYNINEGKGTFFHL